MFLETITFASGSEIGGIPNCFGILWGCIYPLWVWAYRPETFSHKRRSPKLSRNDSLRFSRWIVGLWLRLSMNNIWFFSEFLYAWFKYRFKSLQIISLVWPTRLIFLAMGEVLSFGFNLTVSFPSDSRGSKACIVLLPSRIKRWGLYHIARVYPCTSCHLA